LGGVWFASPFLFLGVGGFGEEPKSGLRIRRADLKFGHYIRRRHDVRGAARRGAAKMAALRVVWVLGIGILLASLSDALRMTTWVVCWGER
jgi:hypothetical protein